jgi:hypothetical protein
MVVGLRNACILGADFLKSGGMVVDIANSKLTWPLGEVALVILAAQEVGDYRFCVDFRRENSVTKKDAHPMLRIYQILVRWCALL